MKTVIYPTITKEFKAIVASVPDDWKMNAYYNRLESIRIRFFNPETNDYEIEIVL